jgi:hypothetical protein
MKSIDSQLLKKRSKKLIFWLISRAEKHFQMIRLIMSGLFLFISFKLLAMSIMFGTFVVIHYPDISLLGVTADTTSVSNQVLQVIDDGSFYLFASLFGIFLGIISFKISKAIWGTQSITGLSRHILKKIKLERSKNSYQNKSII